MELIEERSVGAKKVADEKEEKTELGVEDEDELLGEEGGGGCAGEGPGGRRA